MNKSVLKIFVFSLPIAFMVFFSCAKQVGLTGGPVDNDPPEFIFSTPDNGSVNFNKDRIRIFFDEYIQFNNLSQKLIISPPIDPEPDIFIRGKGIQINLDPNALEANTTYSFNFNDAIADITENNTLHSFIFAFSTGSFIDSLQVRGRVIDAYSGKPAKEAHVLLHDNLSDTAFKTLPPVYLSKVNDKGEFTIPFLKEGTYNIFAIEDANFNYKFDLAEEPIAFLDSVIVPSVKKVEIVKDSLPVVDSIDLDSLKIEKDLHKKIDTVVRYIPDDVTLNLFTEDFERQYIKDRSRKRRENIQLIFNRKQYHGFNINVVGDDDIILVHRENPDTVDIWLTDTAIINSDSIRLYANYISHHNTDSVIYDTLRITSRDFDKKRDTILNIKHSRTKHPAKDYEMILNSPVAEYKESRMKLGIQKDTIFNEIDFAVSIDSVTPLKLLVSANFEDESQYTLILQDSFATDIYGLKNIADTVKFSVTPESDFGSVSIALAEIDEAYIIELLKGDKVVYSEFTDDGTVQFRYIKPDTYRIKLIKDKNRNRRWDTGNYKKKIQPEPIIFYPGEVEVRANWNHEIDWDFNEKGN